MTSKIDGLRVLIVTPFTFIAEEVAKRLAKKGVSILIISHQLTEEFMKDEKLKSIYFFSLRENSIDVVIKLLKTLISFKPNVIQMYTGGGILGLLTFPFIKICSIFFGSRIVSWIMEPVPRPGIYRPRLSWIETKLEARFASLIITDTEKLKKLIEKVHKIPPKKVIAFTNEWDATLFYRYRKDYDERKWILFFGTVSENKGLEYLIKAEPIITKDNPDAKIVIAGRNQEKYYNLIKNKNNYILLNRFISYREGAELFQKSMIIVLPYTSGTVSGIIPVAYAFKKPIIATRVGCFDEVVEDGKTGILIPPRDHEALAKAIILLLEDKDKREGIGKSGFTKLKTEFSWDIVVDKMIAIYLKLIS
ncbi:glycosyltransferase family 4 protein [Candidatus Bathyarchaeota archaeon]|nr:glycosyltransferase family 4 protein [Candidatus Bathyarchaeota archaeon]